MDSDEYKEKVAVLLNDTNTYLKLMDKRLNPTTSVEKDLNKILLNIKKEKNDTAPQFGPNLYRKLHCGNSTPASFLRSSQISQTWKATATHHKQYRYSDVCSIQISGFSPVASEEKHLHSPKQFCFYTANKTVLHLQQRPHGLL